VDNSTKMNPNLKYAEIVRGKSNMSSAGIMAGRDLTDVIDAIGLIQGSSVWTKEDQAGIESWFTKYLDWLMNSKSGKKTDSFGNKTYADVWDNISDLELDHFKEKWLRLSPEQRYQYFKEQWSTHEKLLWLLQIIITLVLAQRFRTCLERCWG
jgi:hypothetical protein